MQYVLAGIILTPVFLFFAGTATILIIPAIRMIKREMIALREEDNS